jgi:hypothetical protein
VQETRFVGVLAFRRAVAVAGFAALLVGSAEAVQSVPGTRRQPERELWVATSYVDTAAEAAVSEGFVAAEVYTGQFDHVAAGTGLRNAGFGTIQLRGTPDGAKKKQAFLYIAAVCENATCPNKLAATMDGTVLSLSLIGTAAQPCWTGTLIGAYRADVTAKVKAGIDADYKITQVKSGVKTGSNPWQSSTVLPLAEGATLLVIYSHPDLSPGAVYLHHGANTPASGTTTYTLDLASATPGTTLRYTTFGADGQLGGIDSDPSTSVEMTGIGYSGSLTSIAGPGTKKNDSDWNGSDGFLWDTHTHIANGLIPAGVTSYDVRFQAVLDCIVPVGHVLTAR